MKGYFLIIAVLSVTLSTSAADASKTLKPEIQGIVPKNRLSVVVSAANGILVITISDSSNAVIALPETQRVGLINALRKLTEWDKIAANQNLTVEKEAYKYFGQYNGALFISYIRKDAKAEAQIFAVDAHNEFKRTIFGISMESAATLARLLESVPKELQSLQSNANKADSLLR